MQYQATTAAGAKPDGHTGQKRIWVTWMTCCSDGLEHAVTEEGFAAGYWQRSGIYQGVCGHSVVAQALVCPPGRRCRECAGEMERRQPPPQNARKWARLRTLLTERWSALFGRPHQ